MTKTINEFVKEFNDEFCKNAAELDKLKAELCNPEVMLMLKGRSIMDLYDDGYWVVDESFGTLRPQIQHAIMDYVYNSEPKDWFDDNGDDNQSNNDDDEIVVDGIQMTKKEADQLYDYFTKKQQEELYKELKKINGDFNKITKLLND